MKNVLYNFVNICHDDVDRRKYLIRLSMILGAINKR